MTGRAILVYLGLAGAQRVAGFLIVPFVSHLLSPAEYGTIAVVSAVAFGLSAITGGPVEPLLYRYGAAGGERAPAIIRAIGLYVCAVLPAAFVLFGVGIMLSGPELFGASGLIWGIEIVAIGLASVATSYALPIFRARRRLVRFSVLAASSLGAMVGSKIVFVIVMQLGVFGWVLSDLTAAIVGAALGVALVRIPRARVTRAVVREVAMFALPLIPHRTAFWAVSNLSRPAMALVATLAETGVLAFALSFAGIVGVVIVEIQNAVIPEYGKEEFPAPRATRQVVRIQVIAALVVPALAGAAIAVLVPVAVAQAFWEAIPVAGILMLGQAALGFYVIPMNYATITAEHTRYNSITSGVGALVILGGVVIYGTSGGAAAAAWATTMGYVVMALLAFGLASALRLRIAWRVVFRDVCGIAFGIVALGLSFVSTLAPVGSPVMWGFATMAVILSLAAVSALFLGRSRMRQERGDDSAEMASTIDDFDLP